MGKPEEIMNETILKTIGLTKSDFDEEVESDSDLISSVTTSGRLYRKVIQYLVLKELRLYLDSPHLNYSDDISKHFKYRGRKKKWSDFRDWMNFKTPELGVENFAILLMVAYVLIYGYYVLKLIINNADFSVHVALSGLSLAGLIFLGAIGPVVLIFHLGKTELPAKNVEGLVDKIIQENMHDFLTDDKENLKRIIRNEIGGE